MHNVRTMSSQVCVFIYCWRRAVGAPAGLCIVGGQCDGYVLWVVYC